MSVAHDRRQHAATSAEIARASAGSTVARWAGATAEAAPLGRPIRVSVPVVGGWRLLGAESQPTGGSLVVAELAGDASVVWQIEAASAGAFDDLVGVAAVQRLASGETAVVATRRFTTTGDLDVWVVKLAAGGKSFVADKQVAQVGVDAVFGAAYSPQVGWWAAGQQGTGGLARAWLVRLSESWTVLASWKSAATGVDHLRAAVILPDGGALAVGDREEAGIVRALLVRVDAQGALVQGHGTCARSIRSGCSPWWVHRGIGR